MSEQASRSARTFPYRSSATGKVIIAGVLLAGLTAVVAARCYVSSALWLDESLSVSIARLPLSQLPAALRLDGSPPLYYFLLHLWIELFGTGNQPVRLLSGLFGVLALPLMFAVGSRLRDRATGWCAVLLLAVSPFAVHYATETRMYSLVVLEVLLLGLALLRARERPSRLRLAPIPVVAALLLYTHYWSLFLLTALGAALLTQAVRGPTAPTYRRLTVALALSAGLFAPWLSSFLEQLRHTGTPWAQPPAADAFVLTVREWAGGGTAGGELLTVVLAGLFVLGLLGRRTADADGRGAVLLRLPVHRPALGLLGLALGGLVLGLGAAMLGRSGYAYRYSSVLLVPALLLAALGLTALPTKARAVLIAVVVLTGGSGVVHQQLFLPRTQAAEIAAALQSRLRPGDLVVYCPDQLGPAVSRLLAPGVDQVVYPSFARPERVDWRDYQQRNAAAVPASFAATAAKRTSGTVFLVWQGGYRTFGMQCEDLATALKRVKGSQARLVKPDGRYAERHHLDRFPAASSVAGAGPR